MFSGPQSALESTPRIACELSWSNIVVLPLHQLPLLTRMTQRNPRFDAVVRAINDVSFLITLAIASERERETWRRSSVPVTYLSLRAGLKPA